MRVPEKTRELGWSHRSVSRLPSRGGFCGPVPDLVRKLGVRFQAAAQSRLVTEEITYFLSRSNVAFILLPSSLPKYYKSALEN